MNRRSRSSRRNKRKTRRRRIRGGASTSIQIGLMRKGNMPLCIPKEYDYVTLTGNTDNPSVWKASRYMNLTTDCTKQLLTYLSGQQLIRDDGDAYQAPTRIEYP